MHSQHPNTFSQGNEQFVPTNVKIAHLEENKKLCRILLVFRLPWEIWKQIFL
ncbi:hypothetical protein ACP70R_010706 [Stipagrostis hirtigluma subsp. patula]